MNERPGQAMTVIRARAAEFLALREAGWSRQEAADFALWRATDPRHDAAVREIEATQQLLARLPESPAAAELFDEVEALCRPRRRGTRLAPWLLAAGTLAAAACVAFLVALRTPLAHTALSFGAPADRHRTVALTDGSTLLLNNGSEVDVEFLSDERRVNLRQGEVHFSVAKDEARPFIVAAGAVKVRAVGTAFNVKRGAASVDVVVTEGKVRVSRDGTAGDELFLVAGEGVVIGEGAPLPAAGRLPPDAMREKLAWQAPLLKFADTPLAEAVERFNRYSRVQLEIGDRELGAQPIGGSFYANNSEAFVSLLLANGDIRVERVSETRLILRKAR